MVCDRVAEDELRAPGCGGRRRGTDQDNPCPGTSPDPTQPELRVPESEIDFENSPFYAQTRASRHFRLLGQRRCGARQFLGSAAPTPTRCSKRRRRRRRIP